MKTERTSDSPSPAHSRRQFLRGTVLGSVFLAFTPKILRSLPSNDAPSSLRFFDQEEFEVFAAVADRLVGPRPTSAPSARIIAQRADAFLAGSHPEIQEQFHLLLPLFNSAVIAFLFDLRFSSFLNMSSEEQDSYLDDWMLSSLEFRRTAFQGLKRIAMSVYYTHDKSWEHIGFDGDFTKS